MNVVQNKSIQEQQVTVTWFDVIPDISPKDNEGGIIGKVGKYLEFTQSGPNNAPRFSVTSKYCEVKGTFATKQEAKTFIGRSYISEKDKKFAGLEKCTPIEAWNSAVLHKEDVKCKPFFQIKANDKGIVSEAKNAGTLYSAPDGSCAIHSLIQLAKDDSEGAEHRHAILEEIEQLSYVIQKKCGPNGVYGINNLDLITLCDILHVTLIDESMIIHHSKPMIVKRGSGTVGHVGWFVPRGGAKAGFTLSDIVDAMEQVQRMQSRQEREDRRMTPL